MQRAKFMNLIAVGFASALSAAEFPIGAPDPAIAHGGELRRAGIHSKSRSFFVLDRLGRAGHVCSILFAE
jgi:hypothetical protein